jgi:hypothetical protein
MDLELLREFERNGRKARASDLQGCESDCENWVGVWKWSQMNMAP